MPFMSYIGLTRVITLFCLSLVLAAGCAQKIVRPTPGPPQGTQQIPVGFPGQVQEAELQAVQAELKSVYFDYDSYVLSPAAQTDLQYNAEILRRTPNVSIVVEGHCDERGTSEYNLALGDRRARAVLNFMTTMGLPPQRFSAVSYGAELPVNPGHNEQAWAQNRRSYLRVSK
ncbi:MAG: peptidoglycan-associated lipoprotein Pal [Desulfomonile tiedjei]|nr:peptidoglycan-associated lipoprotein Pal [Desulfomonile tiedjei]